MPLLGHDMFFLDTLSPCLLNFPALTLGWSPSKCVTLPEVLNPKPLLAKHPSVHTPNASRGEDIIIVYTNQPDHFSEGGFKPCAPNILRVHRGDWDLQAASRRYHAAQGLDIFHWMLQTLGNIRRAHMLVGIGSHNGDATARGLHEGRMRGHHMFHGHDQDPWIGHLSVNHSIAANQRVMRETAPRKKPSRERS